MNWKRVCRMTGLLLFCGGMTAAVPGCSSPPADSIYFEELSPREMDRLTMEATCFALKNPSLKAQFKPALQRTPPEIRSHYDGNRHGKVEFRWELPVVNLPKGAAVTTQSVNPLLVRVIASGDLDDPEWKFANVRVDSVAREPQSSRSPSAK